MRPPSNTVNLQIDVSLFRISQWLTICLITDLCGTRTYADQNAISFYTVNISLFQ